MNKIAICIPTYKRPLMLDGLIKSIAECNIERNIISEIDIIIVDNDDKKTARPVANKYIALANNPFNFFYFNHPVKGLANVRNELLRQALKIKPDYIIFIDDDEYVSVNWLSELVSCIINNNADAVRGPVLAVHDSIISKYIDCWFQREKYPNNTRLTTLTTGNLILRRSSLEKYDTWFDQRFNSTGAEDSFFGIQLLKKGASIFWASKAIVYETIPKERANLHWLLKRKYRVASAYTYILRLEKQWLYVYKKFIVSVFYILLGVLASVTIFTNYKKKYWGALKIAEGLGGISGAFNVRFEEYKNVN